MVSLPSHKQRGTCHQRAEPGTDAPEPRLARPRTPTAGSAVASLPCVARPRVARPRVARPSIWAPTRGAAHAAIIAIGAIVRALRNVLTEDAVAGGTVASILAHLSAQLAAAVTTIASV